MRQAWISEECAAIEANLRRALASYATVHLDGIVDSLPGLFFVASGVAYPTFNIAMLSETFAGGAGAFSGALKDASRFFRQRRLPWSFWLCEEMLDPESRAKADRLLVSNSLRLVAEYRGMVAGHLLPPARPLPELELQRVSSLGNRRSFRDLMSSVFNLPEEVSSAVYEGERYWGNSMVGWIGYLGGRPVCSAATVTASGVIGLYSVATAAEARRRGCAEAITRLALMEAAADRDVSRLILQSTPAGFGLYCRLGFRDVARFAVYVSS